MRKYLLFTSIAFTLLANTLNAQITKGSILLGGNLSFETSTSKNSSYEIDNNIFSINPAIGVAIKENSVLGVSFNYFIYTQKSTLSNAYKEDANSYGSGLFYRQYKSLSSRFYLFGDAGAGYYHTKITRETPDVIQIYKSNSVNLSLYPGITYAVSKRFHLEASLNNLLNINYSSAKTTTRGSTPTTESTTNGFSFMTNISSGVPLSLGFRFIIPK
jgi:hypothetical protein